MASPVKMDVLSKTGGDRSRTTVTLQNIQVGPQDRTAFEVPAGFSKLPGGGMFRSPALKLVFPAFSFKERS